MDITTPQRLFHGTVDDFVPSFRAKLLDSRYWRPGRDFGEGFYTTISAEQARKWAVKATKGYLGDANPCVLEVELRSVPLHMVPMFFLSDSLAWATFILGHRKMKVKGQDPCRNHPDNDSVLDHAERVHQAVKADYPPGRWLEKIRALELESRMAGDIPRRDRPYARAR